MFLDCSLYTRIFKDLTFFVSGMDKRRFFFIAARVI